MKSIVSLLALASDRNSAATWASELEKNGFAHHSAEEIKRALQVSPPNTCTLKFPLTICRSLEVSRDSSPQSKMASKRP